MSRTVSTIHCRTYHEYVRCNAILTSGSLTDRQKPVLFNLVILPTLNHRTHINIIIFNHSNIMSSQVERETCTARCSSSELWSLTHYARTSTPCSFTSHQVHPRLIWRYLPMSVQDVDISHHCDRGALSILQHQYLNWILLCKCLRWRAERRCMGRDWPHNQPSKDGGKHPFNHTILRPSLSCHAVGPSLSDYLPLPLFIPYSLLLLKLQTLT